MTLLPQSIRQRLPACCDSVVSMRRLVNPEEAKKVTKGYPLDFTFDIKSWLANPDNYALIEGRNIAFGEKKGDGIYHVHFCFDEARGRTAIELTRRMLSAFYHACPVRVCVGLIREDNRRARWLIRQVGFTSLGMTDTDDGRREMFFHTNKE
jgi:hypothetical protein